MPNARMAKTMLVPMDAPQKSSVPRWCRNSSDTDHVRNESAFDEAEKCSGEVIRRLSVILHWQMATMLHAIICMGIQLSGPSLAVPHTGSRRRIPLYWLVSPCLNTSQGPPGKTGLADVASIELQRKE